MNRSRRWIQRLVLYPHSGLVGVRLVDGFPGYDAERDGFRAFPELLRALREGDQ
jgi:hypothetical protein